jgi:hypothetical protein
MATVRATDYVKLSSTGETLTLEELIRRVVNETNAQNSQQRKQTRIVNASSLPQQSRQWDFLIITWAILAILSSFSAILSVITFQYVLAIIQGGIFVGAFISLLVGGFRYVILALFLLLYMFTAFLFTVFYAVALMYDYYNCSSTSCAGWRLFLFQMNYIVNVMVAVLVFLTTRACWLIITEHRKYTSADLAQKARNSFNPKKED